MLLSFLISNDHSLIRIIKFNMLLLLYKQMNVIMERQIGDWLTRLTF